MPEWRNKWEVQPLDVPDSKWCSNRKGLRVGSQSLLRHLIERVVKAVMVFSRLKHEKGFGVVLLQAIDTISNLERPELSHMDL